MIKGTIIVAFLFFVMGCSNQSTQPDVNLGQAHDVALIGSWWLGLDTITFNSSGNYTRTNIYMIGKESGLWYTFYGTLYMESAARGQYKFEYELDNDRIFFCTYELSSINPLICKAYHKTN
jgi:hypothetical protein